MRVHSFLAVGALPARRDARDQDVVANFEVRNAYAHLFDDSDTFVPQYSAIRDRWHITFHDVQVRSTNRRLRDLDDGIGLSLIHISEPTRLRRISYAVFCLKK